MTDIEVVADTRAVIGESPTWSPTEQALYWIDVKAPALFRFTPAGGAPRRWPMTADIGAFALQPNLAGALVALRTGLHMLEFDTGALSLVAPAPFDPALLRFNEGGCDTNGRFWVGVMFDPADPSSLPLPGALHSYTRAGGLRPEPDAAELHNGMAWTADGSGMFLSHSQQQTIFRFDLHNGHLSGRRIFGRVPPGDGIPDGAALDTAGGYWCALHGGGRLRRFHADGTIDRDVTLPVSQPTMCAFAGPDLGDLYVTSATDKLSPAALGRQPHAGALLRLRPGERGIPRRCTLQ